MSSRGPIDPRTGLPLEPRAQPGYYPGFSTLAQQDHWEEATRKLVLARVHEVPPIRFFTQGEAALLEAVMARILPQDDRDEAHRIPIVNGVDERLFEKRGDGYRFEDMPEDGEAHRLGLQAIEEIARHIGGRGFRELPSRQQDEVLQSIHDGKPKAGEEIWRRMNVKRYWHLLVKDAIDEYYAHPYAWDEIGFGGPAYPRGYMRLERGDPEPWEVDEVRYEWGAPPDSLSDRPQGESVDGPHAGQGGTH